MIAGRKRPGYKTGRYDRDLAELLAHPERTDAEIAWTIVPILILVGMAVPATRALIDIEDNTDADLTVLVTASQWKWHYQYVEADIGFFSNLATSQEAINNLEEKDETYLLAVDNPLVLPTNKKVRFLMTSGDVIHSWWNDYAIRNWILR